MSRHKKITILVCVFLIALNIAACGQVTEDETVNIDEFATNQQESNMQTVESTDSETKEDETVNADESAVNQQKNSAQTVESINPETFPLGEYHDDMGSQLIISKDDDKNYNVTYGIYKLTYMEDAVGSYDVSSGILSFSGIDINESTLSADVAIQEDNLLVTLTQSAYPDCPAGTTFQFEPDQS